jgi:hypothetical protein
MKKLFILLIIIIISISCHTTKQVVKDNVKAKTEEKTNVVTTTADVKEVAKQESVIDKGVVNETVEESTITTNYTLPDITTGKQFPIQTIATTRTIKKGEQKDVSSKAIDKSKEKIETKVADKSDYKSEIKAKITDKKETKDKTPAWIWLGSILVITGLFLLAYLVLKRYGFIK